MNQHESPASGRTDPTGAPPSDGAPPWIFVVGESGVLAAAIYLCVAWLDVLPKEVLTQVLLALSGTCLGMALLRTSIPRLGDATRVRKLLPITAVGALFGCAAAIALPVFGIKTAFLRSTGAFTASVAASWAVASLTAFVLLFKLGLMKVAKAESHGQN